MPISSSSQNSIAAMKNFLADGRLTPSGAPTDHPYTLPLALLGRSVGAPEGVGGGRRSSQSPVCSAPAPAELKQIVHKSSSLALFSILSFIIM